MAEVALFPLMNQVAAILDRELQLLYGVPKQVAQIGANLRSMRAFLKDAERRQDTEEEIKEWVKQVRELAFEMEDVLDEFFIHHDYSFIKRLKARHQIATQIPYIKLRIDEIVERRAKFSFQASNQGPSSSSSPSTDPHWLSSRYMEQSELVGTDNIRNELMMRLIDGEPSLNVISVFGEGGVGKTTLVRKVFESQGVKAHFSCYAWITVSQSVDAKNILKSLIKQQYYKGMDTKRMEEPDLPEGIDTKRMEETDLPKGLDTMDYADLIHTLREYLDKKRYVIVLDDIWSENAWTVLKSAFPANEKGSRIFVTTRKREVAWYCSNSLENVYPFKPLPPPEAWELFSKKTFRGSICPPHLKGVCEKIVKRCGGLPLAIVAIGAFLWKKNIKNLWEWELVYGSLGTEIVTDDTLQTMSRILWLSYNDLPDHLKSCFLYFSHFPDHAVKRARLTRMWVAEGFIKPDRKNNDNRTLEEIAEAYLNELVTRSLIHVSKVDCFGRVERCRVHHLIRELILQKADEEKFCMSLAEENTRLHDKTRHLSIYNGESVDFSKVDRTFLLGVRSLFMLQVSKKPAFLSSFRLLKVLTLKGRNLKRFPSEIVNLFHLRYINMRRTGIEEIPNSIGKLQNLQTLDLKYTWVKELPKGILKLKKLRHLLFKVSFVYLGVKLPTGIGHLNCLKKLASMDVTNVENRKVVKELGKLAQLRRLGITGLRRREDVESLFDSIVNMKELQSLYIGACHFPAHFDVSFLSKYSLRLPRSIHFEVPLLNLTDLMPSFQNLVKLKLRLSRLRDDPLKSLHYLPDLAFLHLGWAAFEGEELSCEGGGFPSLRVLRISTLEKLKCVRFEEGAMPLLEKLCINQCLSLDELPIGIEHLTSLKELDLRRNSDKLDEIIIRSEGKIGPHQMDISEMVKLMGCKSPKRKATIGDSKAGVLEDPTVQEKSSKLKTGLHSYGSRSIKTRDPSEIPPPAALPSRKPMVISEEEIGLQVEEGKISPCPPGFECHDDRAMAQSLPTSRLKKATPLFPEKFPLVEEPRFCSSPCGISATLDKSLPLVGVNGPSRIYESPAPSTGGLRAVYEGPITCFGAITPDAKTLQNTHSCRSTVRQNASANSIQSDQQKATGNINRGDLRGVEQHDHSLEGLYGGSFAADEFPWLGSSCAASHGKLLHGNHSGLPQGVTWSKLVSASERKYSNGLPLHAVADEDPLQPIIISEEDFLQGCEDWSLTLVGYVLGGNPSLMNIKYHMERAWRPKNRVEYHSAANRFFLFRFSSESDLETAWEGGPWVVVGKPLILKKLDGMCELVKEELTSVPLWIKLPYLDLRLWTSATLSRIANRVGTPLCVDGPTARKSRISFAKVCVEVNLFKDLPDHVEIATPVGQITQRIEYKWKPDACRECRTLRHTSRLCPLKQKSGERRDTMVPTVLEHNDGPHTSASQDQPSHVLAEDVRMLSYRPKNTVVRATHGHSCPPLQGNPSSSSTGITSQIPLVGKCSNKFAALAEVREDSAQELG